jgi:hypothetical protein
MAQKDMLIAKTFQIQVDDSSDNRNMQPHCRESMNYLNYLVVIPLESNHRKQIATNQNKQRNKTPFYVKDGSALAFTEKIAKVSRNPT